MKLIEANIGMEDYRIYEHDGIYWQFDYWGPDDRSGHRLNVFQATTLVTSRLGGHRVGMDYRLVQQWQGATATQHWQKLQDCPEALLLEMLL